MLRIVAYAPDSVRRFPVHRNELLIGSGPECDICLPYSGVAQAHARILYDGRELRIEDLGSRKGLFVSGRKVKEAFLEVLDEIRVGGVTLLVEDVAPPEEKKPEPEPVQRREAGPPRITPDLMIQHLHRVSNWVLADAESRTTSEALVGRILDDFGGGALFLLLGEQDKLSVKLTVASDPIWLGSVEELTAQTLLRGDGVGEEGLQGTLAGSPAWVFRHSFPAYERAYTLVAAFPGFSPRGWAPVASLHALGHLLVMGLVHHVGSYEPILPGHPGQQDLTLDPGLVIGDSQSMKQVLEQLRVAVDPDLHVLLRGEPGVGKELLARSLHLSSGSRRNGPFVVASCGGAKPAQVEADLFGAVVAGKGGMPVRREGKLALAHGGTLFLDDVDQLPLDLQARLVRFLRSGEVEPMGGTEVQKVDVRLVAGSRGNLEAAVARDTFRVDLAYRLAQVTIEVPALRDRREDLPLLIQAYVNRACHETGKRIQGITVKAMSALLSHDYPGNLAELENIARQLVYMSPTGRPVEASLLPERVRNGTAQAAARLEPGSDLDLEHLVGGTEQAAIREALKRTHGNKSQAARLLGLSRNGLATKMERHGIQG